MKAVRKAFLLGFVCATGALMAQAGGQEMYENPYIKITVNSINNLGAVNSQDQRDKVSLSLTIVNKTDKDIFLRYNGDPTIMGSDGIMSAVGNVNGLSQGEFRFNSDVKYYTRIFAKNETTVNIEFFMRDRTKANTFTYSSRMAIFNEEDSDSPITFGAGIKSIKLK